MISCIIEYLTDHIKHEIKQCTFYSIQIGDTTDITQKTQCSIIFRYITKKSELNVFLVFMMSVKIIRLMDYLI
jgi:hypothetical protein